MLNWDWFPHSRCTDEGIYDAPGPRDVWPKCTPQQASKFSIKAIVLYFAVFLSFFCLQWWYWLWNKCLVTLTKKSLTDTNWLNTLEMTTKKRSFIFLANISQKWLSQSFQVMYFCTFWKKKHFSNSFHIFPQAWLFLSFAVVAVQETTVYSVICANLKCNKNVFLWSCTLFENYSKCRIWIFPFWHFPPFFFLLKLNCLVALFDRKLAKLTIFDIFNELLSKM